MKINIPYNLAEQTLVKLMRTGDRLWRKSDEWFAQWEITDNHYNILRILNGANVPLSQKEIGERLVSSRANITKLIDLLEKKHFVERLACEDRRVKKVALTKLGTKFIAETKKQVMDFAETNMKNFSEQDLKTLITLLDKIEK
jgi:MarR family 2-MHQ and catechol resistance regulon transcriptional repressor